MSESPRRSIAGLHSRSIKDQILQGRASKSRKKNGLSSDFEEINDSIKYS